ncbi:MAG: 2-isopropylmalate synthase [Candidatus Altiarchaeales archaeon]|nr:MAG: 2-isopropylmalate synthase [Candidatus Altiarchaeales archaeon]HDO82083.1 2-isopropylmalate synthase [Candidatus Altiarchaeales archaeon]HEX54732.1 2-isopropylmalate synthase [Candidatus Altiarchaeales archaeon]
MTRKIRIFDTTLRDGEQTPGVALDIEKKLEIAHALSDLGVDIIEAGFPINSKSEFEAVKRIAKDIDSKICGLARALKQDIDKCIDADVHIVHTFISTSPQHLKYQMEKSEDEVYEMAVNAVEYVVDHGFTCLFSPMDATRSDLGFLLRVCKGVENAGAKIINIPDTVGIMYPSAMKEFISKIRREINVDLDVHCHNDFGMAVANTLAAVEAGVNQVQVAVNGLGERAGNADLEQVVMALKLLYKIKTNIKTERIYKTSKLVERLTGVRIMPNFPIVGENAFAHESGIHVHAVLKKPITFEPIKPEMVGARRRLVIGKHVGTHGIEAKLKEFKINVNEEQLREITNKVKELGGKGKRIVEEDLIAIAEDVIGRVPREERIVELIDMELNSKFGKKPTARVVLNVKGEKKEAVAEGVGPVDAVINAIRIASGENIILEEYHLDAITGGSDALADVTIRLSDGKNTTMARGVSEDIVMASVMAFINGLNRLLRL